jgi:AcrR family transcriptional regulator
MRYHAVMATRSTASKRNAGVDTGAKLIAAAAKEFRRHGFLGTDTNKIARRAGFAPQTFYRWFADKTEIFLAVYRAWEEDEKQALIALQAKHAPLSSMVEAIVAHHRDWRVFRRSLRRLSIEDDAVRQARAESRLRQIERFKAWRGALALGDERVATMLFEIERLCDAIAEDEFVDLGLSDASARSELTDMFSRLRG